MGFPLIHNSDSVHCRLCKQYPSKELGPLIVILSEDFKSIICVVINLDGYDLCDSLGMLDI